MSDIAERRLRMIKLLKDHGVEKCVPGCFIVATLEHIDDVKNKGK